nr:MAG TPA: attachment protein [Inoviridae sp.]
MRGLYARFVPRFVPHLARGGLVLLGLSWAVSAQAQALPNSWSLVPKAAETANGYRVSYSPGASGTSLVTSGRTVAAAANDAVIATESAALRTAAGEVSLTVGRAVAGSVVRTALANAAIGVARGGLVGAAVGAGVALAPLLEQWMKDQGYMKDSDGTYKIATGGTQPSVSSFDNATCFYKVGCFPTTQSSAIEEWTKKVQPYLVYNGGHSCDVPAGWTACIVLTSGGAPVATLVYNYWLVGNAGRCPDGSRNEKLCPGELQPGPAPTAAQVAQNAAAAPMPATITDWEDALDKAAAIGYPVDLPDTAIVTGPATATGPETVTSTQTITDANGQTKTLTETAKQVAHLTYSGDQVIVKTETVTSTQNPDGSTTQTTKSDSPSPDVCSLLPNVLGCTQLGTPEAASMPTASKAIAYTAESVSLPTGCPAPISMGRFGSLSFQPACDSAGYMKPLILAGSAITALMICAAAVAGVKP